MQELSSAGTTSVFLSLRPTTQCYKLQQPIEQRNPTQLMRLFICRSAPMSLLPLTWWDSGDRCNQIHKQSWIFPSMLPPSERSPGEDKISLIFHRPDDFWSFTTQTVFYLSPPGWFFIFHHPDDLLYLTPGWFFNFHPDDFWFFTTRMIFGTWKPPSEVVPQPATTTSESSKESALFLRFPFKIQAI